MIDPPHCTAESNTALQSNYTIIKKIFLKRKLNIKNLVKRWYVTHWPSKFFSSITCNTVLQCQLNSFHNLTIRNQGFVWLLTTVRQLMKLEQGKLRIIAATNKLYPLKFPRSPFITFLFPIINLAFSSHSMYSQCYRCSHCCFVSLFSITIFMFLIGLSLFEKNEQSMLSKNNINFVFLFLQMFSILLMCL